MNLLNLKNRIKSIKNIGQVTKAMELVAATKMRKAQLRVLNAAEYSKELTNLVSKITVDSAEDIPLLKNNNSQKKLLIIIGPSKGLAGALVSNLSRETYNFLKANSDTDLITIDKKGIYIGERSGKKIIASLKEVKTSIQEYDIEAISRIVKEEYKLGKYNSVSIVVTHFTNTLSQHPIILNILPVILEKTQTIDKKQEQISISAEGATNADYLVEPNQEEVINRLLDKYIDNKIFVSILDSLASEYSARMIAMKNASDNARDLRTDLTLEYNQSRQAAITQQILEIAGAVSAMGE